jgi:acyl-CoA thioesterase
MGEYAFDADTSVSASGAPPGSFAEPFAGSFAAELTGRWDGTNGAVNGGYMLAICLRALGSRMPYPDPIVISGFFLRPGTPGPAVVRTSVTRSGRTTAFGEAVLTRDGKDVVRASAAFATLGPDGPGSFGPDGPVSFAEGAPPSLPAPSECVGVPVGAFGPATIAERVEFRSASLPGWFLGSPTGRPASEFWMRFADGRDADLYSLPLLVDSTAPSVLELGVTSTTVQLTVHLRAHPAPGWLACRAAARFVSGGYHEEDFEVWDSSGTLVAQSRQLAMILPLPSLAFRVAREAGHRDGDVERARIDLQPEALAVPDHAAGRSRDGRTAVTGVGQPDSGQIADGVRNRDRHVTHDDARAGAPAGRAELRGYCRQVPADAPGAARPAQHVPLLVRGRFHAGNLPSQAREPT